MVCPFLIHTKVCTKSTMGANESTREEMQSFDKCVAEKCPFYRAGVCLRVKAMCERTTPLYIPEKEL